MLPIKPLVPNLVCGSTGSTTASNARTSSAGQSPGSAPLSWVSGQSVPNQHRQRVGYRRKSNKKVDQHGLLHAGVLYRTVTQMPKASGSITTTDKPYALNNITTKYIPTNRRLFSSDQEHMPGSIATNLGNSGSEHHQQHLSTNSNIIQDGIHKQQKENDSGYSGYQRVPASSRHPASLGEEDFSISSSSATADALFQQQAEPFAMQGDEDDMAFVLQGSWTGGSTQHLGQPDTSHHLLEENYQLLASSYANHEHVADASDDDVTWEDEEETVSATSWQARALLKGGENKNPGKDTNKSESTEAGKSGGVRNTTSNNNNGHNKKHKAAMGHSKHRGNNTRQHKVKRKSAAQLAEEAAAAALVPTQPLPEGWWKPGTPLCFAGFGIQGLLDSRRRNYSSLWDEVLAKYNRTLTLHDPR